MDMRELHRRKTPQVGVIPLPRSAMDYDMRLVNVVVAEIAAEIDSDVRKTPSAATVVHNTAALSKAAEIFNVTALLPTAFDERQHLVKEDERIVDWVQKTGRKKLVIAWRTYRST